MKLRRTAVILPPFVRVFARSRDDDRRYSAVSGRYSMVSDKIRKNKILSRLLTAIVAAAMCLSGICASALFIVTDTVSDPNDGRVFTILSAVREQNFSVIDADKALGMANYFMLDSRFAAIKHGSFPYSNYGGWTDTVTDGVYSVSGIQGAGCFAYAKFVSGVFYGSFGEALYDPAVKGGRHSGETLKSFIASECQAGEHIRISGKHSVTFLAADAEGFYFMEYLDAGYIRLGYSTYENFADYAASYGEIFIYNADPAKNDVSAVLAEDALVSVSHDSERMVRIYDSEKISRERLEQWCAANGAEILSGKGVISLLGESGNYAVAVPLGKLYLLSAPSKVMYSVGDSLDLTGISVTAVYGGCAVALEPGEYSVFGYDAGIPGIQTITVKYGDQILNFSVAVSDTGSVPTAVKGEDVLGSAINGDVDGDGKVSAADARLLLRNSCSLLRFTEEQKIAGDVDGDGRITSGDARIVLRRAAGLAKD